MEPVAMPSGDFQVKVCVRNAVIERVGEVIRREADGSILFRYRKPRSSKRVTELFSRNDVLALAYGRRGQTVLYALAPISDALFEVQGALKTSDRSIVVTDDAGRTEIFKHPAVAATFQRITDDGA